MWKKFWAASLLGAVLAGAARPARADEGGKLNLLTPSGEVFEALIADPREIQMSAAYYRLFGENKADVALGHSWGMARWTFDDRWKLQWDIEAMAYSRFLLGGSVNEFEAVDFIARLPIDFRHDSFSGRGMLFHQSSHLGDDYIRRTGDLGFRYSVDGLRGQLAYDIGALRPYIGGIYLLHTVPSSDRGAFQCGFELTSPELRWFSPTYPTYAYLGQDLQSNSNVHWNTNSRSVMGVRVKLKNTQRAVRLQLGYFNGHSPYGQFYQSREHYADISIALEI